MTNRDKLGEYRGEFYDIAPCGYLSTLTDGTIVKVNETFLSWTGYAEGDLVFKKRFQDLLSPPGKIFYEMQFAPLLHMQPIVKEVAFDLICAGRDPLTVLVNSTQIKHSDGSTLVHSAFFDATDRRKYERDLLQGREQLEKEVAIRTGELEREITVRRKTEEHLRSLTARLLTLRDEERRSLARELHDSVGQLLAALSMNIAIVNAESHKMSARAASAVAENAGFVNQISSEIRTISYLLHPPLLDEVGLKSALTWFVEGLASRAGMKINLELPKSPERFEPSVELAIFRMVQECLTNVHRHSGSKTATVRLIADGGSIRLEVQDQGSGLPANRKDALSDEGSGVGLRGMRERVKQLGGEIEIRSDSSGTLVKVVIPKREGGAA
jgi:signal transduction histidine kinase